MLKNRQEDNERLEEEITESREDMNKMLESFRRRERGLQDDLETLQHKNGMLSDLLDLITDRAESTQKELDKCRKEGSGTLTGSDVVNGCDDTLGHSKTAGQKDSQVTGNSRSRYKSILEFENGTTLQDISRIDNISMQYSLNPYVLIISLSGILSLRKRIY